MVDALTTTDRVEARLDRRRNSSDSSRTTFWYGNCCEEVGWWVQWPTRQLETPEETKSRSNTLTENRRWVKEQRKNPMAPYKIPDSWKPLLCFLLNSPLKPLRYPLNSKSLSDLFAGGANTRRDVMASGVEEMSVVYFVPEEEYSLVRTCLCQCKLFHSQFASTSSTREVYHCGFWSGRNHRFTGSGQLLGSCRKGG